ncbi:bifunctional DNA primase/polymerase [Nonomuraea guangzhouensis]|uniref:Bifunctional DNA primase/polymerase n=1 Tax=Nonomuraea guangzhouensis TaxID=1291555 RepID=A0ABW4GTY0_9ACTN|nr:bifunctional DNA primase/polymerase [Nonomuraea guangzhouensis]
MRHPLPDGGALYSAALELARYGVVLTPGSYIVEGGTCSCGDATCRRPGSHPLMHDWLRWASNQPSLLAQWWSGEWTNANLMVPLIGHFDVLDLPIPVAEAALHRLRWAGNVNIPVVATPGGRRQVWVEAGGALSLLGRLPKRLPRRSHPDLRLYQRGSYVVAPPSRLGPDQTYNWHRPLTQHISALADVDLVINAVVTAYTKVIG